MKNLYILIMLTAFSCSQNTKEKTSVVEQTQNAVTVEKDSLKKKAITKSFTELLSELQVKMIPLLEATDFDSFIEPEDYKTINDELLKLQEIYPNFHKEGYNYKAIANYRLQLSDHYHTIVTTIKKGDHEMESVLVNYNLGGAIIGFKVVSYDEIAEGMSKIESKISSHKITVNNIVFLEENKVTTTTFEIDTNGKINPIIEPLSLLDDVMQQLKIDKSNVQENLVRSKMNPSNSQETIVVIPVIIFEDEDVVKYDGYIALVNSATQKITHQYKINGWQSDAIILGNISIDTAAYIVTKNERAFGVRVSYYSRSQPNPYSDTVLSLYVKSADTLKEVLNSFEVLNYHGEWDTRCAGGFTDTKSTLLMTTEKTNGYFDILVKNQLVKIKSYIDENGECIDEKQTFESSKKLEFNGKTYIEK